jgi:hypothetical protein
MRGKDDSENKRMRQFGMQKLSAYEESVNNDPNRITKYNAFMQMMSFQKLKQKNIMISDSIAYKRPTYKMSGIGQGRSKSTLR